jgi:hypothetical protein
MEAMLGTFLHSYPYLNWQKCFAFLIIAYVFSSTKLEKRQNRFCLEAGLEWRGSGQDVGG